MRILARPAYSNRNANPYNWLLYTHMTRLGVDVCEFSRERLLTGSFNVWHLHWPEAPLNDRSLRRAVPRLAQWLLLMDAARMRGIKIVWTIHNLAAHEEQHPRIASWFWKAFVRRLDGFINLSAAGQKLALQKFPQLGRLPGFIVPHGHYRGVYTDRSDVCAARTRLNVELDSTVLAFVGQIRRYKGLPDLCRAFSAFSDHRARLLIAGTVKDDELARELQCAAIDDPRIRLHCGFIPHEDLHLYLRAADLIVLPFVNVLNSASALLALSFDRPVLVPQTGPFSELQDRVGREWVRMYEGELTTEVLSTAVASAKLERRPAQPRLESLDWPLLARQTADVFTAIVGRAAGSRTSA